MVTFNKSKFRMLITKTQRAMLEKIWVENEKLPLQLVYNVMNKNTKTRDQIEPTENGEHNPKLRKIIPKKLLDHLLQIRIRVTLKIEN